jgi:hypothetical protein
MQASKNDGRGAPPALLQGQQKGGSAAAAPARLHGLDVVGDDGDEHGNLHPEIPCCAGSSSPGRGALVSVAHALHEVDSGNAVPACVPW